MLALLEDWRDVADLQSSGTVPVSMEVRNSNVRIGATSSASSLSTLGEILSGPQALLGFNPFRSFLTPSS